MRILRNLSIRTKLIFLATISACIAILLTSAAFVFNDMSVMRVEKVRQMRVHVEMMHFTSSAMTRTDDDAREQRRHEYLNSRLSEYLTKFATITYGCMFDRDGLVLATYQREPGAEREPPNSKPPGDEFTDLGELELYHPIGIDGELVATVYIHDDANDLRLYFLRCLKIAMYVTLFSCLLALLLSIRLQSMIARPIQELSNAVNAVGKEDSLQVLMPVTGRDEISMLHRSFNKMLGEVQEARCELEDRVDDRTRQLRMEIAERKKIEADLVRACDGAQEASHSKSAFLANMSHEIRTPLNAILGFSELLKKNMVDSEEERESFLGTVISSGRHLLELINGILDLSKIEAGQMEMERRRFSPDHVIASAISVMSVKAAEKDLELTYQWSTGVPETIENDEARMRQALINLIGNAIKFTEKGGVHITCSLLVDRIPAMIEIKVRDTGIGIAADKLDAVLEPFVQADASVTRRFGGTGLGLAITRRIADLLGGKLSLTSQLGVGTEFTLKMLAGKLDGVAIRAEPIATIETQHTIDEMLRTDLSGTRIMIVEDVVANRKLIRIILSRAGAEIIEADNGLVGYETAMAADRPFDAILMDMQMPIMDGYEATKKLRESGYTGTIVALTANAMKGDDNNCMKAGCDAYLPKPIDTNEVLVLIRQVTGKQALDAAAESNVTEEPPAPSPKLNSLQSVQDAIFGMIDNPKPAAGSTGSANAADTAIGQSLASQQAPDATPLLSELPTDDEDFREIVMEFIDGVRIQIPALRQAFNSNDVSGVEHLAHSIKGAGGSAGFPDFTRPAGNLMNLARSGQISSMAPLIDELADLMNRLQTPAANH